MAIAVHDVESLGESMNTQILHAWLQAWNTSSVKEAGACAPVLTGVRMPMVCIPVLHQRGLPWGGSLGSGLSNPEVSVRSVVSVKTLAGMSVSSTC